MKVYRVQKVTQQKLSYDSSESIVWKPIIRRNYNKKKVQSNDHNHSKPPQTKQNSQHKTNCFSQMFNVNRRFHEIVQSNQSWIVPTINQQLHHQRRPAGQKRSGRSVPTRAVRSVPTAVARWRWKSRRPASGFCDAGKAARKAWSISPRQSEFDFLFWFALI